MSLNKNIKKQEDKLSQLQMTAGNHVKTSPDYVCQRHIEFTEKGWPASKTCKIS